MVSQLAYGYVNLGSLLWPCYPLFLYLFPNGRAVPAWTRWIIGAVAMLHLGGQSLGLAASYIDVPAALWDAVAGVFAVELPLALVLVLACQLYRYLRVSTNAERAQIKWFVGGMALFLVLTSVVEPFFAVRADVSPRDTGVGGDIEEVLVLAIPISLCIAILRYRLYDIDIIIRRTLIYAVLTALLAGVYFGGVALLQALLRPLSGEGDDLAVVATTLLIAALFLPLRSRVQGFIDRRFYRRKYDAAGTLAAFGERVRDEVELDELTGRLVEVVNETMRPAHVSLWLAPRGQNGGRT